MQRRTGGQFSRMDAQLPVPADPYRSPTKRTLFLLSDNPYSPPTADHDEDASFLYRIPRLNGFVQGVRDALVFSGILLAVLVPVFEPYGKSLLSTTIEFLWIPVIWCIAAGVVAESRYRKRVPDPSKRRRITVGQDSD